MDTIFAVSSGAPPAAIAIMRLSGPGARGAACQLAGELPPPRQASLRALRDPADGTLLDRGLVLWFAGPATATGEDIVELHLHGGRATVAAIARALAQIPGLRAAEPGEFTRRALMSGRIDLAEAEALGDLLMAETEAQRRRALADVEGGLSRAVHGWTASLLTLSARVEAALDFADEDDVGATNPVVEVASAVAALAADIGHLLAAPPVERVRDGIRVVLAGPPNAGKSTLLNALADREAAIVSPIAGTTRDRIEAPVVRDGTAYLLIDTAGLARATDDPIEAIGIDRAEQAIAAADLLLWLDDARPPRADAIWLFPRADVRPPASADRLAVSAQTGEGLPELWARIGSAAAALLPRDDQLAANQRQRALLTEAAAALDAVSGEADLLIVAEQLRLARNALDRLTGAAHVEDMLDALFGRFCIGK